MKLKFHICTGSEGQLFVKTLGNIEKRIENKKIQKLLLTMKLLYFQPLFKLFTYMFVKRAIANSSTLFLYCLDVHSVVCSTRKPTYNLQLD